MFHFFVLFINLTFTLIFVNKKPRNEKESPSFISFACSTLRKMCAKTHTSVNQSLVMSKMALMPH